MNPALHKTLAFALIVGVGVLMRRKLADPRQLDGVKALILSVALPATIFVALLTIEVEPALLALPVLALAFNGALFLATRAALPAAGVDPDSPRGRTLQMLVPSLAPGLSCFPYVLEYLGDGPLAWAALADVGNKVFVLVLLYLLAMHWHRRLRAQPEAADGSWGRLGRALVQEPVNLVLVAGLALVAFGIRLDALPLFLQDAVERMSALMTPMVLLFIALAVRARRGDALLLTTALCGRAGFALGASALVLALVPMPSPEAAVLAVVFPLSACSFWPYAHLATVEAMGDEGAAPVFDVDLGLAVLAFSLPVSTALILAVCSAGETFSRPLPVACAAAAMLAVAGGAALRQRRSTVRAAAPRFEPDGRLVAE